MLLCCAQRVFLPPLVVLRCIGLGDFKKGSTTLMLQCETASGLSTPWSLLLLVSALPTQKYTNKICARWIFDIVFRRLLRSIVGPPGDVDWTFPWHEAMGCACNELVPRKRSTSWTAYLNVGFDDSARLQEQANWKLAKTPQNIFLLDEQIR